ncbi:MAG TPA: hypothetical protein VHC44_11480 [Verrucomicrobiae bacterium]|nr:hypothetical protein [Verrucomicrobiae bacterium]
MKQFSIGQFQTERGQVTAFVTIRPDKLRDLVNRAATKKHRQSKLHFGAIVIEVLPLQKETMPLPLSESEIETLAENS